MQKNIVRASVGATLCLCAGLATGPGLAQQAPLKVTKVTIQFTGPANTSETLVRSHIRIHEGDAFSPAQVDDDIRNLYSTGYFRQIQVQHTQTAQGVALVYNLQGKPKLTNIKVTGNKEYSETKIRKKITSKTGEPLDEKKLFTDAQAIQKFYQDHGFHQTIVKPVPLIEEQTGRSTVTFEITESPKVKITQVVFEGAKAFPQKKLKKVVKTRRRWWLSWLTGSGRLKDDVLDDDKEKLAEFYRDAGYIDFDLKDVKVVTTAPNKVEVHFTYSEGRQYKVGAVTFKGSTLFTPTQLTAALKMPAGKTFTPPGLNKDLETLRDLYGERGYIDAAIIPIKQPNVETGTMDLVYQIEEGIKSYIEKIEIKGNNKTKDKVIRRELAVAPGEVFDMVSIKLSKKRLEGLNYFEKVDAQPEPTDVPNRKNLVVGVDEKSTGNFTVGAGFSSVDSLVGYVEMTQGNFDLFKPWGFQGGGEKLRMRATVGTVRQDYLISFIEPWFMERKLSLGVDLYHRVLNYVSVNSFYDERRTGARLSLTRALGSDYLIGSIFYNVENVGIVHVNEDPTQVPQFISDEKGYKLVSKVGGSLAFDTRDNVMTPTKGFRSEIYTELAGGPFGADVDYFKAELRHSQYVKGFFPGHLWEIGVRGGGVESYGKSDNVPFFDRYYLGGLYSLRGFKYRNTGPHDPVFGEPMGGDTYWFGSIEYTIPIIEETKFGIKWAFFYDVGNVYSSPWSLNYNKANQEIPYYDNWGLGLRLNLPIGPLRFDYGIPIHTDTYNGRGGKFQFGVGYTRDF